MVLLSIEIHNVFYMFFTHIYSSNTLKCISNEHSCAELLLGLYQLRGQYRWNTVKQQHRHWVFICEGNTKCQLCQTLHVLTKLNLHLLYDIFQNQSSLMHKYHHVLIPDPTMHHFATEMCTCVHISVTKCCIGGYMSNALWDIWDGSFGFYHVMHKM